MKLTAASEHGINKEIIFLSPQAAGNNNPETLRVRSGSVLLNNFSALSFLKL